MGKQYDRDNVLQNTWKQPLWIYLEVLRYKCIYTCIQAYHKHVFSISKSKVVSFKFFVFMQNTVFLKVSRILKLFRMHKFLGPSLHHI